MGRPNKRIAIIGAGRGQLGLYKAAKRMGLTTIAVGLEGDYPGLALADEKCFVDLGDPDEVLSRVRKLGVDAAATSCHDTGIEALGMLCDELGLPGLSLRAARASGNKLVQKKLLLEASVSTAFAYVVHSGREAKCALRKLSGRKVVKRLSSQGSSGVFIFDDSGSALQCAECIIREDEQCIVEEYISGEEFGAQAFVSNGEVLFVLPHHDLLWQKESPAPIGHWLPFENDERARASIKDTVKKAVRALGLDDCAVNVDLKMDKSKEPIIIELTGRAGSNGLPELLSEYYGTDYYEKIIEASLGIRPSFSVPDGGSVILVKMAVPLESGIMPQVDAGRFGSGIVSFIPFIAPGCDFGEATSLKGCIGQVIVRAKNEADCFEILNREMRNVFGDVLLA